jgi:hypothetical protein
VEEGACRCEVAQMLLFRLFYADTHNESTFNFQFYTTFSISIENVSNKFWKNYIGMREFFDEFNANSDQRMISSRFTNSRQ